jgi:putative transposase
VSKYLVHSRKPPSQTWRTFLENHVQSLVPVDFFVVPTIRFQILYVLLVLADERRRIVHFAVTAHPTAKWTAQQMREAFPWDTPPRYLLRDRDRTFCKKFVDQLKAMGIFQCFRPLARLAACLCRTGDWHDSPRVPGSPDYFRPPQLATTPSKLHPLLSPEQDAFDTGQNSPEHQSIRPPASGRIIAIPEVGGLHHRYERRAA